KKHHKKKARHKTSSESEQESEKEDADVEWQESWIEKKKDKDKEGDNAVVGPLPIMQDAANQDIRDLVVRCYPVKVKLWLSMSRKERESLVVVRSRLTSNEIATFEHAGYVMSGSRASSHGSCSAEEENRRFKAQMKNERWPCSTTRKDPKEKINLVGLQGDDTSENQPQEMIPHTTLPISLILLPPVL
ncbi:hypothetical protein OS493_035777, partial [Desmophyllum pertusum]